jgi:DNA-binding CsgD family transcriptional regulator
MAPPRKSPYRRPRTASRLLPDADRDGDGWLCRARARRELLATGDTVRKRTVETLTDLTAQEAQIAKLAKLAKDGHTNQEIAAKLFISPRTVEWHLTNVFTKLGITSRKDLR